MPKEKQEILEEVELCGLRATARKWKIAPSTVATWKKELAVDATQRWLEGRRGSKADLCQGNRREGGSVCD